MYRRLLCCLAAAIAIGLLQAQSGTNRSNGRQATPDQIAQEDPAKELEPLLRQFLNVLDVVNQEASEKVPSSKLIYEGAIPSMLHRLDPHTQFFDPGQFDQLKQMERSEQKGFGSIVSVLPGRVIFLQTLPGTPTNKAGINPGDELMAVDNIPISALEMQQIIGLLSQARQKSVQLYVRRPGNARLLHFVISPELLDAPSVDRAFLLGPNIGYVRVSSFDLETGKQLKNAIEKLGGNQLQGLVLDLRNNPGGVVKAALDAASFFLEPGQRILTARGRVGKEATADAPQDGKPYSFRVAVLVNGKTASAAEILTGALQDHDRATVIGEPTFGKGLVQSVMPLSEGAGLAITTAFYYTPSGRSIQKPLKNSQLEASFQEEPEEKRPKYKTDSGRTVTGGGGIRPDQMVLPPSPTRLEAVIEATGSVTSFATQYLGQHSPLPDSFEISPDILDDFKIFLSQRRIQPNVAEWAQERVWLTSRLKQEIVTQAKGVAAGDEVEMQRDPQVKAAVRAMSEAR